MGVVLLPCAGAPPAAGAAARGGAGSGNKPHSLRLEPSSSASLEQKRSKESSSTWHSVSMPTVGLDISSVLVGPAGLQSEA